MSFQSGNSVKLVPYFEHSIKKTLSVQSNELFLGVQTADENMFKEKARHPLVVKSNIAPTLLLALLLRVMGFISLFKLRHKPRTRRSSDNIVFRVVSHCAPTEYFIL